MFAGLILKRKILRYRDLLSLIILESITILSNFIRIYELNYVRVRILDCTVLRNSRKRRALSNYICISHIESSKSKTSFSCRLWLLWPNETSSIVLRKSSSNSMRHLWSCYLWPVSRWRLPWSTHTVFLNKILNLWGRCRCIRFTW